MSPRVHAVVGPELVRRHVERDPLLSKAWHLLEHDEEVQSLLKMSNVMAVTRLRFNDHGVMHARIVSGAALEILELLWRRGIEPTTIRDHIVDSLSEAKLIVLLGAYLHDIGNSVHRVRHHEHGYVLAMPVLDRILSRLVPRRRLYEIRQEILHIIYSHDEEIPCLTIEAGVVKVADGTDMAEGRARIPYQLGKVDIHAVSALSIERVELAEGRLKPVRIIIHMKDSAGLFQVEKVLMRKIETSGIKDLIEVESYLRGEPMLPP